MIRFFEPVAGINLRRDFVESIRVVTNSGSSHDVVIRTVSGELISINFTTVTAANAERDRILSEEV